MWTAAAAPLPAQAAQAVTLATAGALAAAAAAAVGFALAGLCWARTRALRAELRRVTDEADRDRAALAAVRDAFFLVDNDDNVAEAAPGLAGLLGAQAGRLPRLDDVAATLAPEDAAPIAAAVRALVPNSPPFMRRARTLGGRAVEFAGSPAGRHGAAVWVRDVSAVVAAEADAASARAKLAEILDSVPIPIWRRNGGLGLDYVNRAYAAAVDANGVNGASVAEIGAGIVGEEGRGLAVRARETGQPQSASGHVVIDGARRLLAIAEVPVQGNGAIVGYALDRTETEESTAALSRYVTAHEDVLHHLGTAIAIYGADQRLQFFNHAFVQLWGLEEQWLRGAPTMSEVLEELRARRRMPEYADFRAFKKDQLKLFTSLIDRVEDWVYLPDGTTLRAMTSPHPFGGLLLTWEDVTDRLRLERSYNTLIEVQRETLDHLYEGIAVIGGDGRLKLSNPAFGLIWHLSAEFLDSAPHVSEIVDRMREFVDTGAGWPAQREEIISAFTDRTPRSERLERTDGSVLDWATVPLPDGAVLLSYVDVSDSIRVERALLERNEALETADRLKSEFIANVSYELRTPLNSIIGFAEILTGQYFGSLNDRQVEYSRGILDSSKQLLLLINDILDLAMIEAGHMQLELESLDIHGAVSSVLGLVRERARKKKIELELDCPLDIGRIVADERRLKQALFNILSNALKFTPDNGAITVTAARDGASVVITVQDTGIGISERDQARVFDKFERGSNLEARRSGAGLGLSLVKSFVELHGGKVELESAVGQGTKVVCTLPAEAPATAA
ncbi:MAG: ATP-binding protein [Rhodospirillales bacterium]